MVSGNTTLGRFSLVGIPPAPRGIPQIEVTFDIDVNGIIHVSAKDLGTGNQQKITISAPQKLSDKEIEKMVKDAEKFAEEDRKNKEKADTRNAADTLVYSVEKAIKELGDKLEKDKKEETQKKLEEVREAMKGDDTEKIKKATEDLSKASQELFSKMYQEAAQKYQQEHPQEEQGKETKSQTDDGEKVVDAEFKVEDDKK
jgi:molecular chaperone DnaK